MRGRITIASVIYVLLALVALGALWPVLDTVLETSAPYLSDDEELVFSTLLPIALVVLLSVIYVEARTGVK